MPTVAEMDILGRSLSDLSRTFQGNRTLRQREKEDDLDRAMRQQFHGDDMALRREDQTMRRDDAADARENRRLALETQQAGQKSMEQWRKDMAAAKTEDDKFQVFVQMAKEGALTDEGIAKMSEAFNAKFGQAGLGVKLFKLPTVSKAGQTTEAQNLALAENYRERAAAALRAGDGPAYERFRTIAARLERGGTPEAGAFAQIEKQVGAIDPLTGKGSATVTQKVPSDKLEAAIADILGGAEGSSGGGKSVVGVYDRVNGQLQRVGQPPGQPSAPPAEAPPKAGLEAAMHEALGVPGYQERPTAAPAGRGLTSQARLEAERSTKEQRYNDILTALKGANAPNRRGGPSLTKQQFDALSAEAMALKRELGL